MKPAKLQSPNHLDQLWHRALRDVEFSTLIREQGIANRIGKGSALLFWGKAAQSSAAVFERRRRCRGPDAPQLVISPENAGHPLPDRGSFAMGMRILDFFDYLGRSGARNLAIFLSGGASSLAWIRPAGVSEKMLRLKLERLYRQPLTVLELNRRRSRLCLLKQGGAARWLKLLAPAVRARVFVLSDVAPFTVETVGSGPFAATGSRAIFHHVLADNSTLVKSVRRHARRERILELSHSTGGSETAWARDLSRSIRRARGRQLSGLVVRGGEPWVRIGNGSGKLRGGRQCQIAARLALEFWEELRRGELEILCASSDGQDGSSGAAAAHLCNHANRATRGNRAMPAMSPPLQRQLEKAIATFDTARFLSRHGFLIPAFRSGTNVQDIVIVRIRVRAAAR